MVGGCGDSTSTTMGQGDIGSIRHSGITRIHVAHSLQRELLPGHSFVDILDSPRIRALLQSTAVASLVNSCGSFFIQGPSGNTPWTTKTTSTSCSAGVPRTLSNTFALLAATSTTGGRGESAGDRSTSSRLSTRRKKRRPSQNRRGLCQVSNLHR